MALQIPLAGLYSSALDEAPPVLPPATSTLPLGSNVVVCVLRAVLRLPVLLNVNGPPAAVVSVRETAAVVERRRKAARSGSRPVRLRRDGIFIIVCWFSFVVQGSLTPSKGWSIANQEFREYRGSPPNLWGVNPRLTNQGLMAGRQWCPTIREHRDAALSRRDNPA